MSTNLQQSIAKALLEIGAVGFSPDAPITFKSGIRSPVYVDNRALIYHPRAWKAVVEGFRDIIATRALDYDVIAGVAVGGVPHSSALAYSLSAPSVFIRKESKGHGKGQRIEGGVVDGKRALLVEDLVTTGGSSLSAVSALRDEGATVTDLLAIVSYGFDEAVSAFSEAGVTLRTLTDFEALLDLAERQGQLDSLQVDLVRAWLADPHNWERSAR